MTMYPAVLDLGVSKLPMAVFLVVHLTALAIAVYLASRAFGSGRTMFAWAFSLFGVAEVLYMGYHVAFTTFLLSHTLAEVCNLVAFILVFVGMGQDVASSRRVAAAART